MELFARYDLKAKERNLPLYVRKAVQQGPFMVTTDKAKLNKILSNLLDNAFKFTNKGQIDLGYSLKQKDVVFYVKDTGIGIAREKSTRIFERFSQESNDIAQSHGGLGLGLSIAKENAELLGGSISVESEKGKGSTFYVVLPLNSSAETDTKAGAEPDSADDVIHILVAEDEEVNYQYLEIILGTLSGLAVRLYRATNGQEAVEICQNEDKLHLVLMDIKMPVMNGYVASKKIRELRPHLPFIAQTAYSTLAEKEEALKYGCDDFISKPIQKDSLLQLVYKYINK